MLYCAQEVSLFTDLVKTAVPLGSKGLTFSLKLAIFRVFYHKLARKRQVTQSNERNLLISIRLKSPLKTRDNENLRIRDKFAIFNCV